MSSQNNTRWSNFIHAMTVTPDATPDTTDTYPVDINAPVGILWSDIPFDSPTSSQHDAPVGILWGDISFDSPTSSRHGSWCRSRDASLHGS